MWRAKSGPEGCRSVELDTLIGLSGLDSSIIIAGSLHSLRGTDQQRKKSLLNF